MTRQPSLTRNLGRLVLLDFTWSLRVPQNLVYQFFVSGVVLLLLAQINQTATYRDTLVPGVIALVIVSQTFQSMASTVSYMRAYGALRTIHGSPIPTGLYLASMLLGRLVRVLFTVGFMLLLASWALDYQFRGDVSVLILSIALGVGVFGALGLVVTFTVAAPQAVTSILNALFLAMMFSSNTLFATSVDWLRFLSIVSPLTFLSRLLRENAQGIDTFESRLVDAGVLLAWFLSATLVVLTLLKRHSEER